MGSLPSQELHEPRLVEPDECDPGAGRDAQLVEQRAVTFSAWRHLASPRQPARYAATMADGPLLVYGPRSPTYDFGPGHPLTPRRFGPGIDLLRSVGAEPGLAPEPAPDADLLLVHTASTLSARSSTVGRPYDRPEAGIGQGGDDPAFAGMHDAAAAVAGGSLRG